MADNNPAGRENQNQARAAKALNKATATRGAEITPADVGRARAKWLARVPDFLERIRTATGQPESET